MHPKPATINPTKRNVPFHNGGATDNATIPFPCLWKIIASIPTPANKNPIDCTGKNISFNGAKSQMPAAYNSLYVAFNAPAAKILMVPAEKSANAPLLILLYKSRCNIIDAVKNRTPSPIPSKEILINQAIIDGINKSAKQGGEIQITVPEI
jgi:hypothetical protein